MWVSQRDNPKDIQMVAQLLLYIILIKHKGTFKPAQCSVNGPLRRYVVRNRYQNDLSAPSSIGGGGGGTIHYGEYCPGEQTPYI